MTHHFFHFFNMYFKIPQNKYFEIKRSLNFEVKQILDNQHRVPKSE